VGVSFRRVRSALAFGLLGALLAIVGAAVFALNLKDDLEVWQTAYLDEEFVAASPVADFAEYLKLEDRLFKQLDDQVYAKTKPGDAMSMNRYQRGSRLDPSSRARNWNRSYVFESPAPTAGVLLLHGMSDSPYSLHHLGTSLHDAGATVIGLRIPGHGTIPSGLVRTTWEDMAAAVRLAVVELRQRVGDKPIYLVGYSNGGALSLEFALSGIEDPSLPKIDGIILISPAIGVTPAAALAVWQGRLGRWFGYEKLAYTGVGLEYDPYKYVSFATNAGDQAYRITRDIDERITWLAEAGKLGELPPILAFQSAVDATVSAPDLVSRLFARLPEGGHELVLFDINRELQIQHILARDPKEDLTALLSSNRPLYTLGVVSNESREGFQAGQMLLRVRNAGSAKPEIQPLDMVWPDGVFSLSHIALPFPGNDALYGGGEGKITLGNLAFRGERGVIGIPPGDMLRQRWNPFYGFLERRVHEFCGLVPPVER
jgi:alpha-beta hydrolase superfamily lysophospholipase